MNSTHRPKAECNNPIGCGNTLYEASYDSDQRPVWRCTNCGQETRRLSRNRRPNSLRAIELKIKIREEWASTDAALKSLVDAGIPSGCLLVHGSAFNYHMEQLSKDKVSNHDIRYHGSHARQDLEEAKKFVQEKQLKVQS